MWAGYASDYSDCITIYVLSEYLTLVGLSLASYRHYVVGLYVLETSKLISVFPLEGVII